MKNQVKKIQMQQFQLVLLKKILETDVHSNIQVEQSYFLFVFFKCKPF